MDARRVEGGGGEDLGLIRQGAFILARVRGEPGIMADHTRLFRASLEVLCGTLADADEPAGAAAGP